MALRLTEEEYAIASKIYLEEFAGVQQVVRRTGFKESAILRTFKEKGIIRKKGEHYKTMGKNPLVSKRGERSDNVEKEMRLANAKKLGVI
jgi:hypothetical protein